VRAVIVACLLGALATGCKSKGPAMSDVSARSAAPSAPPTTTPTTTVSAAPTKAPRAPTPAVRQERLEADVRFVAKPRPPGSTHHAKVRERCAEVLKENGFEVVRQSFVGGENVVGIRPGKRDERVILSAHYDHIPGCSGADDNATGVAVVWEAARVLGTSSFERTLVLACWDDEEAGLNGSAAYATRAKKQNEEIALMISLDGVGYTNDRPGSQGMPAGFDRLFPSMGKRLRELEFRGNFIAVIADSAGAHGLAAIQQQADAAKLPVLGDALGVIQRLALLDAARSDHASFWLQGYPALLVTDTANFRSPYYHCQSGDDAVSTLDFDFTTRVGRTLIGAVADLLSEDS
jgi:hypothetical protein